MADRARGDRFPLLIYRRWAKMLRLPSLLIAVASGVAWWFAPLSEQLVTYDWAFILTGVIGALIFIYSLLAARAAYVQCLPDYLKIRTPLLSVAISYRRILHARPIEFHSQLPMSKMNRPKRRLLKPFLERTVVLLALSGFPVSEQRLRTWLPWFMFATEVTGFVLVVEDWMALLRQISVFSDRWVARHQERRRPRSGFMR
jgi:hypothetical protein